MYHMLRIRNYICQCPDSLVENQKLYLSMFNLIDFVQKQKLYVGQFLNMIKYKITLKSFICERVICFNTIVIHQVFQYRIHCVSITCPKSCSEFTTPMAKCCNEFTTSMAKCCSDYFLTKKIKLLISLQYGLKQKYIYFFSFLDTS